MRSERRFPWWTLLVLPMLVSAATRGWWAPDEPRYAEVAREIVERGDWLVLHLCGEVYAQKPPLLYWIAAGLGWISGWSEFWMRLVTPLAMLGTGWITARLARRAWGEREAAWAPVLLLGSFLVVDMGGRLLIDPLLACLTTGALAAASATEGSPNCAGRNALGAGLLTGLAALVKGPIAFLLVGMPLLSWRCLAPSSAGARASHAARAGAIALALLPVCLWAGLVVVREPGIARDLFYLQHVGRLVENVQHEGPVWKYLLSQPLMALPWAGAIVLGLAAGARSLAGLRRGRVADVGLARAFLWLVPLFFAFSLIPSKRDFYLLPLYPAAALLGARALATAVGRRRARWIVWPALGSLVALVPALALAGPLAKSLANEVPDLDWRGAIAAVPFAGAALVVLARWRRGDLLASMRATAAAFAVALSLAMALVYPAVDGVKSARGLAARLAARADLPARIPCIDVRPESLRFYGRVPAVYALSFAEHREREGARFLGVITGERFERLAPEERERLRVLDAVTFGDEHALIVGPAGP
jgi:4-amino-4-deoxy-L-arabinose transferase-like glycosyltransferase